jgi:SAM-dependent methyltransferase
MDREKPKPSQNEVAEVFDRKVSAAHAELKNWEYMTSKQLSDFALLEQAAVDESDVLNVGCFFPIDEIRYAHRIKTWTATDLGETTIRIAEEAARRHLPSELFERLRFLAADGRSLPFKDESFDVVVSFSTVDHIVEHDDRQQFVTEMARVARRGGRVVLTAPNRWCRGYARRARLSDGQAAPDFFEYCFSPLELKQMLRRAGLEPVKFTSTSEVPVLSPRAVFPRLRVKPFLLFYNSVAKYFGVRMGFLALKS